MTLSLIISLEATLQLRSCSCQNFGWKFNPPIDYAFKLTTAHQKPGILAWIISSLRHGSSSPKQNLANGFLLVVGR
jgi:hypothetical protein